jgi:hypothetical protein
VVSVKNNVKKPAGLAACRFSAKRKCLQHFARVIRQTRTLAARQRDVAAVGPALEAVDDVRQAARTFGEVWRVDLCDVAEAEDLGAGTGTRDQGLDLFWRQVLRLVDDQELVDERAAAHEVERLDLDA